jgi:hypothetical protein
MRIFARRSTGIFLQQFTKPGQPSVNQDTNVTFALSHHFGNVADIKIGDDAQKHRIGLVWWQPTHERDRAGEVVGPIEVGLLEVGAYRQIDGLIAAYGRYLTTASPELIDHAAVADREQQATKLFSRALESS